MGSGVLVFATPGSGQIFENSQWVSDVEYAQGTTTATGLFVTKLTVLRGSFNAVVGRSGIELRTTNGSYRILLLPTPPATAASAIVLNRI